MPYRANSDLPGPVQAHLPPHAQDVYPLRSMPAILCGACRRSAPGGSGAPHRIAWAAVKRSYVKVGGSWRRV